MQRLTHIGRSAALTATTALVITLGLSTGASAADDPSVADTAEVIQEVAPEVEVLPTETKADGTLVAEGENGVAVTAPSTLSGNVALSTDEGALAVGLPGVMGTADVASDGTVVYQGSAVDVAVQALPDGVRVQTVIADASAPTRFEYPLGAGDLPFLAEDGSVVISSDAGLILAEAPWAFDATGAPVATHYEVQGSTLVQVVDHGTAEITYPVVADPTFISGKNALLGGVFVAVRFNRDETNRIAAGIGAVGSAAAVVAFFTKQFPAVAGAAAVVAVSAAALEVWAGGAIAAGKCVEVRLYPRPYGRNGAAVYPLWWGC